MDTQRRTSASTMLVDMMARKRCPRTRGLMSILVGFRRGTNRFALRRVMGNSGNLKISVVVILTDGLSRTARHILKNVICLDRCWVPRSM